MFVLATRVIRIYTPQGISFKEKTRHATPILLKYDRNGSGRWSTPENHPAEIGKSFCAKRKIVRLRLIFRLAQKNLAASRVTTGHLTLAFTPRHGLAPR